MEYAKDEIFSVHYKERKDKLKNPFRKRFLRKIRKNKFITLLMTMSIIFGILDFTLIYYFFYLLNTI